MEGGVCFRGKISGRPIDVTVPSSQKRGIDGSGSWAVLQVVKREETPAKEVPFETALMVAPSRVVEVRHTADILLISKKEKVTSIQAALGDMS